MLAFARLALEAGLPPGVLNVVTGDGETGEALVAYPGVGKVTYARVQEDTHDTVHPGVMAADLARGGVPASRTAFEGTGGYLDAYAGGVRADDRARFREQFHGTRWGIREVTFKPYPVRAFNQAPAAAAVEVARRIGAAEVEAVEVRMSEAEGRYPGVDNAGPIHTAEQAMPRHVGGSASPPA